MENRRGLSVPSRVPQVHDKLFFDEMLQRFGAKRQEKKII
jgi:hypothetical protein